MRYWVFKDSEISGPLSNDDVEGWRDVGSDALVCPEEGRGEADWVSAAHVPELAGLLKTDAPFAAGGPVDAEERAPFLSRMAELGVGFDLPGPGIDFLSEWRSQLWDLASSREDALQAERLRVTTLEMRLAEMSRKLAEYERQQNRILERLGDKERLLAEKDRLLEQRDRIIESLSPLEARRAPESARTQPPAAARPLWAAPPSRTAVPPAREAGASPPEASASGAPQAPAARAFRAAPEEPASAPSVPAPGPGLVERAFPSVPAEPDVSVAREVLVPREGPEPSSAAATPRTADVEPPVEPAARRMRAAGDAEERGSAAPGAPPTPREGSASVPAAPAVPTGAAAAETAAVPEIRVRPAEPPAPAAPPAPDARPSPQPSRFSTGGAIRLKSASELPTARSFSPPAPPPGSAVSGAAPSAAPPEITLLAAGASAAAREESASSLPAPAADPAPEGTQPPAGRSAPSAPGMPQAPELTPGAPGSSASGGIDVHVPSLEASPLPAPSASPLGFVSAMAPAEMTPDAPSAPAFPSAEPSGQAAAPGTDAPSAPEPSAGPRFLELTPAPGTAAAPPAAAPEPSAGPQFMELTPASGFAAPPASTGATPTPSGPPAFLSAPTPLPAWGGKPSGFTPMPTARATPTQFRDPLQGPQTLIQSTRGEPPGTAPPVAAGMQDMAFQDLSASPAAAPGQGPGGAFTPPARGRTTGDFRPPPTGPLPAFPTPSPSFGPAASPATPAPSVASPLAAPAAASPRRRQATAVYAMLALAALGSVGLMVMFLKGGPAQLSQLISPHPKPHHPPDPSEMATKPASLGDVQPLPRGASAAAPPSGAPRFPPVAAAPSTSQSAAPAPSGAAPAASGAAPAAPAAAGADFIPDPGKKAIDFVVNYRLDGNRGTIGGWLQYSFPTPSGTNPWSSGAGKDAHTFFVQYHIAKAGRVPTQGEEDVNYIFEADVERRTLEGINSSAKDLLASVAPKRSSAPRAPRPKPRRSRAVRRRPVRRPGTDDVVPLLPLPEDSAPTAPQGASASRPAAEPEGAAGAGPAPDDVPGETAAPATAEPEPQPPPPDDGGAAPAAPEP